MGYQHKCTHTWNIHANTHWRFRDFPLLALCVVALLLPYKMTDPQWNVLTADTDHTGRGGCWPISRPLHVLVLVQICFSPVSSGNHFQKSNSSPKTLIKGITTCFDFTSQRRVYYEVEMWKNCPQSFMWYVNFGWKQRWPRPLTFKGQMYFRIKSYQNTHV